MSDPMMPESDTGPMPPADLAAEQSVLGGMLLSKNAIGNVAELITDRDFYRPAHSAVFNAALALYGSGEPADAITVGAELERRGELQRTGGAPYLHTLISTVPTAANASYYADIVREKAVLRRLVEAGTRVTQLGYHGATGADLDEVVDRAQAAIHDATVAATHHDDGPTPGGESSSAVLADLADDRPRDLVQTGIRDLDRLLGGGLEPGEVTVVCGRPGHGKTLLALQIARHAALKQRKHALVFSLEMSKKLLMQRLLSATPPRGVRLSTVKGETKPDQADWDRLAEADAQIQNSALWLDDASYQTTATLRTTLRRHIQEHGAPEVVAIDYLGLVSPGGRNETRALEIAAMTRDLKVLAGELGIPIVLVHQLNRQSTQRLDKKPQLADLRDSGAVEQDAFAVIGVHTPSADEGHDGSRLGEADLVVLKNRQGPTGVVTVAQQGHLARFVDLAEEERATMTPDDRTATGMHPLPA